MDEGRQNATNDLCLLIPGDIYIHIVSMTTSVHSLSEALKQDGDGVILSLEVSAGSRSTRFPAGYNEWRKAIQCQIHAPPAGGKANKEIIACIASYFSIPKSSVRIISGAASSSKKIRIEGIGLDDVIQVLELKNGNTL